MKLLILVLFILAIQGCASAPGTKEIKAKCHGVIDVQDEFVCEEM